MLKMAKEKMMGNVVTKNNKEMEVNGKMENEKKVDMEKIIAELKRTKPYAIRMPIALRLAVDKVTSNASEYICQLLLADTKVKAEFIKLVENGYEVNSRKERTNIDNLIKLI